MFPLCSRLHQFPGQQKATIIPWLPGCTEILAKSFLTLGAVSEALSLFSAVYVYQGEISRREAQAQQGLFTGIPNSRGLLEMQSLNSSPRNSEE